MNCPTLGCPKDKPYGSPGHTMCWKPVAPSYERFSKEARDVLVGCEKLPDGGTGSPLVHVINVMRVWLKDHKYQGWDSDDNYAYSRCLEILAPYIARAMEQVYNKGLHDGENRR